LHFRKYKVFTYIFVRLGTQARFASYQNVGMGSTDGLFEKDRIVKKAGEENTREFTYFMLGGARFVYASSVRLALIKVSEIFHALCVQTTDSSTYAQIVIFPAVRVHHERFR
jgi:hypothetical protein